MMRALSIALLSIAVIEAGKRKSHGPDPEPRRNPLRQARAAAAIPSDMSSITDMQHRAVPNVDATVGVPDVPSTPVEEPKPVQETVDSSSTKGGAIVQARPNQMSVRAKVAKCALLLAGLMVSAYTAVFMKDSFYNPLVAAGSHEEYSAVNPYELSDSSFDELSAGVHEEISTQCCESLPGIFSCSAEVELE